MTEQSCRGEGEDTSWKRPFELSDGKMKVSWVGSGVGIRGRGGGVALGNWKEIAQPVQVAEEKGE